MKKTRIAAFLFAVCLGAVSMTACGDSKDNKKTKTSSKSAEDIEEKDLEEALGKLDKETAKEKEEATEAETEPTTVAEIKYEATDEIKKAALNSGYIQIGDTVFRRGNYMTVAEFIEEYGDKFDMSEIPVDEYLTTDNVGAYTDAKRIKSFDDPRLELTVYYGKFDAEKNARVKVTEATIDDVYLTETGKMGYFPDSVNLDDISSELIFYPQDLKPMDYEDAKAFCIEQGFEEDGEFAKYEMFNGYVYYGDAYEEWKEAFFIQMKGAEPNLYNYCPLVEYKLKFDQATLKATGSEYSVSRMGETYFSVDTEESEEATEEKSEE
ncbi:hypothetical protein [Ruminococcus flavefaciens]|uniref:Uncharacterized protein n=1 Tax=Ruminococcus flavefaciens TaxID=1265 RepID=A0A1M7IPV4_RUMFL|nr:hypothetical protein [Ruminococcus flavefaciens]SHM42397.1 hypothetical protein SAMN04487860_104230 [Ruminococcus flavefaciens]